MEHESSFNVFDPSALLAGQPVRLGKGNLGQPVWVGRLALDWEILIYEQEDFWEACFYKWGHHHEHATALSFNDVRGKAENRIGMLEGAVLDLSGPKRYHRRLEYQLQLGSSSPKLPDQSRYSERP